MKIERNGLVLLIAFLFVGCASVSEWPNFSGFLKDYQGMYRSNDVEGLFLLTNHRIDIKGYTKFIVDPITVYLTPEAEAYASDPNDLKVIANAFRKEIIHALEENYAVVERPGRGVLRIRAAITDVIYSSSLAVKEGTLEAEFLDSLTNERVLALMQERKGEAFTDWAQILKSRLDEVRLENKVYVFE